MKRVIFSLIILCLIAVICICSVSSPVKAYKTDTSYSSEAISYFNSQYNTTLLGDFGIYPRSLKGENISLNTLYPVIIAQETRGYIYFCRSVTYDAKDGYLELTFFNVFSYVFTSVSAIDVSDITIPDSSIDKITITYTFENGALRDQFGNVSYLMYLPTSANIGDLTGFTVYNHFAFPTVADYPPPDIEDEISYVPQFSKPDLGEEVSEIVSWNQDDLDDVIDIPGALESIDDDIFVAANGFKGLFNELSDAFAITPVLILLLVIGIVLTLIGRGS